MSRFVQLAAIAVLAMGGALVACSAETSKSETPALAEGSGASLEKAAGDMVEKAGDAAEKAGAAAEEAGAAAAKTIEAAKMQTVVLEVDGMS